MREKSGLCLAGIDYEWPCHLAPRERWCETVRPNRRNPQDASAAARGFADRTASSTSFIDARSQ